MTLFISLLLLVASKNSDIADSLYLEVEKTVSDTLYCSISNQFLEFPFGWYHSLDSLSSNLNWYDNYETIVLNHFNKKDLAGNFYIYKNKRNIVVFRNEFDSWDGAYFVRFALIQDPDIILKADIIKNDIYIGIGKKQFLKIVGIDNAKLNYNCNTYALVTPDCTFGYFIFKEDKLSYIIIDIYDGVSSKYFLNKINDYPKFVDALIDRDTY